MIEDNEGLDTAGEANENEFEESYESSEIDHMEYVAAKLVPEAEFPDVMSAKWALTAALATGLVISLFLWNKSRGINILMVMAPMIAIWCVPLTRNRKPIPIVPLSLFALMSVAMSLQSCGPVDIVFIPLWTACAMNLFFKSRNSLLGLEGAELEPLGLPATSLYRATFKSLDHVAGKSENRNSGLRKSLPGIILAVPTSIILLMLMVSADSGFEMSLSNALEKMDNIPGYTFWTIFYGGIIFVITARLSLAKCRESEGKPRVEILSRFPLESSGVLLGTIAVILLYFLTVHLRTLTMSEAEIIKLTGSNFRAYLRRGFAELVTVEIIIGIVTLLVLHTKEWKTAGSGYRMLAWGLLFLTGCLTASCLVRLSYYFMEYGLSLVRYVNLAGIVLSYLCLGFLAIRVSRPMALNRSLGVVFQLFLVVYVMWSCTFPVRVISEYNAQKYLTGHVLELEYLRYLGPDASPALATVFESGKDTLMPRDVRSLKIFKSHAQDNRKTISNKEWFEWSPFDKSTLESAKRIIKATQ